MPQKSTKLPPHGLSSLPFVNPLDLTTRAKGRKTMNECATLETKAVKVAAAAASALQE